MTRRNAYAGGMRLGLLVAALFLGACAHQSTEVHTPYFDEQLPAPKMNYSSGSIWQASSTGLAEDDKARRKGDILTVVISESASASKEASTSTARTDSLTGSLGNFFGLEKTPIKTWMDLANLLNSSYASKFAGTGSTSRAESLTATMSVKVVDVMPTGNLLIQGQRNVKVNNEDQILVLTGAVRSRDISSDNTISSSLIADAKITYYGKGVVSDRQNPGFLMNFLDALWPF